MYIKTTTDLTVARCLYYGTWTTFAPRPTQTIWKGLVTLTTFRDHKLLLFYPIVPFSNSFL